MKPITQEWLSKAEADYFGALDLRRARRSSNRDLVCYHCQQAVEKLLKARLTEAEIEFPRTHDLLLLLKRVTAVQPLWASLSEPLAALSLYAVEIRYPGTQADTADVREAIRITEQLRTLVLESLGGPVKAAGPRKHKPRGKR